MNLEERAKEYADGKAISAIETAISRAYADGYKDGYADGEQNKPVEVSNDDEEWIDLGLPSGTLWAIPKDEAGKRISLTYMNAEKQYNLPTRIQVNELRDFCCVVNNSTLRGPNGNTINLGLQWGHSQAPSFDYWIKTSGGGPQKECFYLIDKTLKIDEFNLSSELHVITVHSKH